MKGVYRFYQAGVLVGEAENLITTEGKRHIIKFLAKYVGNIAGGIAVGVGNTAANVADTSLEFETARVPVDLVSADYANTAIIFKGKLDANMAGTIYETGLWSEFDSGVVYGSKLLLDFNSTNDVWTTGTWTSTTQRIGADNLRLAPATSATVTSSLAGVFFDFSGYSNVDEFKLAYNVNTSFVATAKLVFHTDASNYFTYTITTPTTGYKITTFNKTNFTTTGTPSWGNIISVDVVVTSTGGGSGSVDFDGLRIEDRDLFSEQFVLVSRAVPVSPIVLTAGLVTEFEYLLDVTV